MKYLKLYESYESSYNFKPLVKKGDKIKVTMNYFVGKPEYEVDAHGDSWYNEEKGTEMFSFLSGDMMMIAKYEDNRWISS